MTVSAGKCDRYMGDISNLLFGFPGRAAHPASEVALSLHVDRAVPVVVVEFNDEPGEDFRAAVRALGVPDEALHIKVRPGAVNLALADEGSVPLHRLPRHRRDGVIPLTRCALYEW